MRFDFVILHVPGKYLHIADALSRAPLRSGVDHTSEVEDIEFYVTTDVPVPKSALTPQWPFMDFFREKDKEYKKAQKQTYDQQHKSRPLDPLPADSPVWIRTGDDHPVPGHIISPAETPRSYIVATPGGELRRTRYHLTERSPVITRSRSGVALRPPDRLRP